MSEDNLYRVIKPYDSNLLHSSKSLMGGASKCYKEVKKVSPTAKNFSVMHMKSNEIYDFNKNNTNNLNQMGGGTNASLSELESLRNQMTSIEKRIIAIEDKFNMTHINGGMNDNMTKILPDPMQSNPIQSNPIQSNPIQFNPIQSNPIQSNPMQQKPIEQLMQRNNMGQQMGSSMIQKPNLVNQQQFGNGFNNQNTKASAFYSAARDFV